MHNIERGRFKGLWSLHFEDGTKSIVSGTLDVSKYILCTHCDLTDDKNVFYNKIKEKPFHITGKTVTNNLITLYGCFFLTVSRSSTGLEITRINCNQVIIGQELLEESVQRFTGIAFELSCFDAMSIKEEGLIEEIPRFGKISLLEYRENNKKKIICSIEFNSELSIQESLDILHEIRCFFVFLYCRYVSIKYTHLKIKSGSADTFNLKLVQDTYSDKKIPNYCHEVLARVGKDLFNRWDNFFCLYKEQIRAIFEILIRDESYSDRGLVVCVHAIEGFFRIISKNDDLFRDKRADKTTFDIIRNQIFKSIESLKIDSEIEESVKSSLSHANELSLRDRMSQLLKSYLNEELRSYFIIHPLDESADSLDEYVGVIVGIRNYYAHLDQSSIKPKIKRILEDYMELYNYKASLFSFLYTLLAKEFFKNDGQVAHRLSNNTNFPFSQQFYDDRIKPIT